MRDEVAAPMASDSGMHAASSIPVPAHSVQRVASVRPSSAPAEASLVLVNDDGSVGARHPISQQVDIGRGQVELRYSDPYLSDRHARVVREDGGYTLLDLASVNGVYRRIREPVALTDGDFVLVGQTDVTVPDVA